MKSEACEEAPVRRWVARGVKLSDADAELVAGLPEHELLGANHVILPTIVVERGGLSLSDLAAASGVQGGLRGILVLEGALTIDMSIAANVCTRLITPSELVLLDGWHDDSIPVRFGWTVLERSTLALLDERLLAIGRRWPGLMTAILRRSAEQIRHALMQQAISQLPRVEDRLLALMWSVADRRGVVRTDGIAIHLPVTHATLAQMIGARRPTVSLGLAALEQRGLLTHAGATWILSAASLDEFPRPSAAVDIAEPA